MRKIIKSTEVEPGKAHANNIGEIVAEIERRTAGMPRAYWNANEGRMVPISYDMTIEQLVDAREYRGRDEVAYWAANQLRVRKEHAHPDAKAAGRQCLAYYEAAQRSDNGLGVACMTSGEKHLASYEWGKRLRELIEAGKRKKAAHEVSVLVDVDDE